jgi:hypothetical protein
MWFVFSKSVPAQNVIVSTASPAKFRLSGSASTTGVTLTNSTSEGASLIVFSDGMDWYAVQVGTWALS